jgi:hypothetical protein
MSTGDMVLNEKLFEIKAKHISLPINLTYSSDVRGDQLPSCVGLGFDLSIPYIERTRVDAPDEGGENGPNWTVITDDFCNKIPGHDCDVVCATRQFPFAYTANGSPLVDRIEGYQVDYGNLFTNIYSTTTMTSGTRYNKLGLGLDDYELHAPFASGRILLNTEPGTEVWYLQNWRKNTITWDRSSGNSQWTIIDESGVRYVFSKTVIKEDYRQYGIHYQKEVGSCTIPTFTVSRDVFSRQPYIYRWYLTGIFHPNGESITLNYSDFSQNADIRFFWPPEPAIRNVPSGTILAFFTEGGEGAFLYGSRTNFDIPTGGGINTFKIGTSRECNTYGDCWIENKYRDVSVPAGVISYANYYWLRGTNGFQLNNTVLLENITSSTGEQAVFNYTQFTSSDGIKKDITSQGAYFLNNIFLEPAKNRLLFQYVAPTERLALQGVSLKNAHPSQPENSLPVVSFEYHGDLSCEVGGVTPFGILDDAAPYNRFLVKKVKYGNGKIEEYHYKKHSVNYYDLPVDITVGKEAEPSVYQDTYVDEGEYERFRDIGACVEWKKVYSQSSAIVQYSYIYNNDNKSDPPMAILPDILKFKDGVYEHQAYEQSLAKDKRVCLKALVVLLNDMEFPGAGCQNYQDYQYYFLDSPTRPRSFGSYKIKYHTAEEITPHTSKKVVFRWPNEGNTPLNQYDMQNKQYWNFANTVVQEEYKEDGHQKLLVNNNYNIIQKGVFQIGNGSSANVFPSSLRRCASTSAADGLEDNPNSIMQLDVDRIISSSLTLGSIDSTYNGVRKTREQTFNSDGLVESIEYNQELFESIIYAYKIYPNMATVGQNQLLYRAGNVLFNNKVNPKTAQKAFATRWKAFPKMNSTETFWMPSEEWAWVAPNRIGVVYYPFEYLAIDDVVNRNHKWKRAIIYSKYGSLGLLQQCRKISGYNNSTSTEYGVDSTIVYGHVFANPTGFINNANFYESGVFTGDYDLTTDTLTFDPENGWEQNGAVLTSEVSHFGEKCIRVGSETYFGVGRNFKLVPNRDYIFSAWIKTITPGKVVTMGGDFRKYVGAGSNPFPFNDIEHAIDGPVITVPGSANADWKYVELRIPAKTALAGWSYGDRFARVFIGQPGDGVGYIDDIRFYPSDALVTTTYYSSRWQSPILTINTNGKPGKRIEYDSFGRPQAWHKINAATGQISSTVQLKQYHLAGEDE